MKLRGILEELGERKEFDQSILYEILNENKTKRGGGEEEEKESTRIQITEEEVTHGVTPGLTGH